MAIFVILENDWGGIETQRWFHYQGNDQLPDKCTFRDLLTSIVLPECPESTIASRAESTLTNLRIWKNQYRVIQVGLDEELDSFSCDFHDDQFRVEVMMDRVDRVRARVEQADADNDGRVSREEVGRLLGAQIESGEAWCQLREVLDTDGDGVVSCDEMVEYVDAWLEVSEDDQFTEAQLDMMSENLSREPYISSGED
eukprot:TRINITY_DN11372_c0_g1_i1.p1 TRINITY_DN11372_c0_g1~~TRINITY_DN11372_c0_g1_i1.p1  ORF type:complete len:198 (-),score=47.03 TRINITY_DN11372_c0_g1_i1:84-677(-)